MATSERERRMFSDRISDAEERLRQSISQRIDRNRTELARLQAEQVVFEAESSRAQQSADVSSVAVTTTDPHATSSMLRQEKKGVQEVSAREPASASQTPLAGHKAAESSCQSSSVSTPVLLLRMTVEIGDGRVGEIEVHRGEEPEMLAVAFCHRHSLPEVTYPQCFLLPSQVWPALHQTFCVGCAGPRHPSCGFPPPPPTYHTLSLPLPTLPVNIRERGSCSPTTSPPILMSSSANRSKLLTTFYSRRSLRSK